MTFEFIILVAAGTLTALLAGIFFAFSVAINGGLGRLRDEEYIRAMQSINREILNPVFLLTFMSPVVLLPLAAFLHFSHPLQFGLLLAAAVLYIVGTFMLTMRGNVPKNDKLEAFMVEGASSKAIAAARIAFEQPWNRLHAIRTGAAILATVLIFIACLTRG